MNLVCSPQPRYNPVSNGIDDTLSEARRCQSSGENDPHQAFRFWHQLLTTWDEAPGVSG